MREIISSAIVLALCTSAIVVSSAQEKTAEATKLQKAPTSQAPVAKTISSTAVNTSKKNGDTLVITARLVEIPGKFAPNDLYNYVYIMKYRVLRVVKGSYTEQEILVGEYNPLIPRSQITDVMKKCVSGNVDKFEVGAKHTLTLIKPIEKVWKDAVEDEYTDSDQDKYFALKTDKAQ